LLALGWHPGQGYNVQHSVDYEGIETLSKARVEDGPLVFSSGRRYSLLALPRQPAMPLNLARAVRMLCRPGEVGFIVEVVRDFPGGKLSKREGPRNPLNTHDVSDQRERKTSLP
jgi:hypothetical protein